MSALDELTGEPIRSQAILTIVKEALAEGDASMAAVSLKTARFGDTFGELGADELAAAVAMLKPDDVTNVKPVEPEPEVEPETEPQITRDQANAELRERHELLHMARRDRMVAETAQRLAREKLAQAISEWTAGGPTPDAIRRNELAAINRDRGNKAAPRSQPGPSYVDRFAAATAGGDGNDFVRKQHRYGGYRRGSMAASQRRPKLPSEL
jgi:hypothetical protein